MAKSKRAETSATGGLAGSIYAGRRKGIVGEENESHRKKLECMIDNSAHQYRSGLLFEVGRSES